ncbi:hypothetical protein Q7P36_010508 [Cladosporium allicinum]
MASSRTLYKNLTTQLSTALKDFQSSNSTFRLLQTVNSTTLTPESASPPTTQPQTLIVLDSSFNPPSTAHLHLALSALSNDSKPIKTTPGPHRLLLLFSTLNADKAPSAASFAQRLTLMTIFATDLQKTLQTPPYASTHSSDIPIDIGVTKAPYYTDKAAAIATTPEGKHWYPNSPAQIHLIGFDTLTRFFAPKYYSSFNPPLSALEPYFAAGHGLRATLRPGDDFGGEEEQRAFREWAERVELVEPTPKAGVSSTVIRKAAKSGEWGVVEELCTGGVAGWVREEGLYEEDDRGTKMG